MDTQSYLHIEKSENLLFSFRAIELGEVWKNSGSPVVVYDLSTVKTISRSFADQLLKEKSTLAKSGIELQLVNVNAHVQSMLEVVAKTFDKPTQNQSGNYVVKFFNDNNLQELFDMIDGKIAVQ